MGTAPILLAWGDDLLLIEEAVAALGARMAAEDPMGGGLPEKVRLKAEGRGSGDGAEVLGELRRRLGMGGLVGGGSPMVVEHLAPYLKIGYRHLIAGFSTPHDEESMIRFAEEVLPKLKQI
ncbi:MAG: hypothetical protein RIR19_306 [Chloroflexota bacterium]|jgi:hypothetical protein